MKKASTYANQKDPKVHVVNIQRYRNIFVKYQKHDGLDDEKEPCDCVYRFSYIKESLIVVLAPIKVCVGRTVWADLAFSQAVAYGIGGPKVINKDHVRDQTDQYQSDFYACDLSHFN